MSLTIKFHPVTPVLSVKRCLAKAYPSESLDLNTLRDGDSAPSFGSGLLIISQDLQHSKPFNCHSKKKKT